MFKDITLGQYYPADSVIHALDPRTKLIATLLFIVSVFVYHTPLGYLVAMLFLGSSIALSKVPPRFIFKGIKGILVLLLFTAVFNICLTPGETLFRLGPIRGTKEGLALAVMMAVRLIFLVTGTSIMTLTTTPNQLTAAMEAVMKPLKRIHVPVHEIAMMMSIALRFIPILMEETEKIMNAQIARGADFETGGIFQKVKNMIPLLVPLFISAFRRANDLALAMEARCYHGGDDRTQMKPLQYKKRDYVAYGIVLFYLALGIFFRVMGW